MCELNVEKDLDSLQKALLEDKKSKAYNTIYFKANEHVNEILSNFDIRNKNVLTVLGSGDQTFHFLNKGAKNVDTFDINGITIYYYYLRVWAIKYLNKYYLNDLDEFNWNELKRKIETSSLEEHQAVRFWDLFFKKLKYHQIFEKDLTICKNEIKDLSELIKRLNCSKQDFYNIDISKKELNLNKKYNYIYTSNISEWVYFSTLDEGIINLRDNLFRHLEDDGIVICSHAYNYHENPEETELFSKCFERIKMKEVQHAENMLSPGYYYIKK